MALMSFRNPAKSSSKCLAIPAHCAPCPVNTKITCGEDFDLLNDDISNGCSPSVTQKARCERCSLLAPRVWAKSIKGCECDVISRR